MVAEVLGMSFYRIPKDLFSNSSYRNLSLGAKAMYAILLSDSSEHSVQSLAELMNVNRATVMKYKKELVAFGLLIDKRVGQGNPNELHIIRP
jgi:predicted transcriptional regulator